MRNLQEQVKKAFCYQTLFWPFTVWINCSSDLKNFANSRPSASNFKSFSWSLEHFFLTVGQNNFGNKIPLLDWCHWKPSVNFICVGILCIFSKSIHCPFFFFIFSWHSLIHNEKKILSLFDSYLQKKKSDKLFQRKEMVFTYCEKKMF